MWLLMRWCSWCTSCSSSQGSSSCLCQLLHLDHCRALQAGRITQGSLPAFVPSCSAAFSFWMGLSSPQELQHLPRGGKRPQKAVAAQGCNAPLHQLELWNSHSSLEGRRGLMWSPEMHRSHPLTARDGPGALQEDPEPGKLSTRVELAPAWPGGAGGFASPRSGALPPLQHLQNSSAPLDGALGMCKEFL